MTSRSEELIAGAACFAFVAVLVLVALWAQGWLLEFLMPRVWP